MKRFFTLLIIVLIAIQNLNADDEGSVLGDLEDAQESGSSGRVEDDVFMILQFIEIAPELLFMFHNEDTLFYNGRLWDRGYSSYPYEDRSSGIYKIDNHDKSVLLNFNTQYFKTGSFVEGYGINTELHLSNILNLKADYLLMQEHLINSNPEHLNIFSVFLNYERVRSELWSLHWGIGYMGMKGDRAHNSFGVNLNIKIFPFNPVSFEIDSKYAVFQTRQFSDNFFALNFHLDRFYSGIGYRIIQSGYEDLGGWTASFGVYF